MGMWNNTIQCIRQKKSQYLFLIPQVIFVILIHVKMEVSVCQDCPTIPFPASVQMASQIPTVLVLWRLVSARFKHFSSDPLFHEWLTDLSVVHYGYSVYIALLLNMVLLCRTQFYHLFGYFHFIFIWYFY